MKLTVISFVVSALGTVPKDLEKELEDYIGKKNKTTKKTLLVRVARILKIVLNNRELHSINHHWKNTT